jgi:hypothetical protein
MSGRRQTNKLAAVNLAKLKPGMHGDGGGLWLQVTPNGRSWIFGICSTIGHARWASDR